MITSPLVINTMEMEWSGFRTLAQSSSVSETRDLAGGIVSAAPEWIPPAIALFIVALGFIIWNSTRLRGGVGIKLVSISLKTAAILLICFCLINPMRKGERAKPQENVVPILIDNSQSMQLKAPGSSADRLAEVKSSLNRSEAWRTRLEQDFDVRQYTFGRRVEKVNEASQADASETATSLFKALDTLQKRLASRPLAGLLLFTDGNLTDSGYSEFDPQTFPAPIYPVVNHTEPEFRDLRVDQVSVQQTDFESSPTKIQVQYEAEGLEGENVYLQLIDLQTGALIEEIQQQVTQARKRGEVFFRFRPEESGVSFYEVLAFTEADRNTLLNPTAEGMNDSAEATLLNNAQIVHVNRANGPYRILYLAGRPNWEYKFLRRSLQADAEVQLVGLIRIAKKEPKFSFRDRSVSSTNPLFAGLGKDEEDAAEQYDEPVLIRLGVKESEELSDGFPTTEEELFAYHGIILDDLESNFFSQDQMLLLRRFVNARGGGLLMLGGQEVFSSESMKETPLGDLAPFYSPKVKDKPLGPYRIDLTREGLLQPWLRLSDKETQESTQSRSQPIFSTLNLSGELKPGASILAVATTPTQVSVPALISQRFGRGRTAAWMIGDLWRSAMRRSDEEDDSSGQAWRQMARWLVNDTPRRVEISVDKPEDSNEPVILHTTVRDETYLPMDNASVTLIVTPIGGDSFEIEAEMKNDAPGVYQAEYWSAEGTAFHVEASATALDGTDLGTAEAGWTQNVGAEEFKRLGINIGRLEELARQTGGKVIRTSELDQFSRDLPNQKVPLSQTWLYPLWHQPWVMTLAIACLSLEWMIRRLKGMA